MSRFYEFKNNEMVEIEMPDYLSGTDDYALTVFGGLDERGYVFEMSLPGDGRIYFRECPNQGGVHLVIVWHELGYDGLWVFLPSYGDYFAYLNLIRGHNENLLRIAEEVRQETLRK